MMLVKSIVKMKDIEESLAELTIDLVTRHRELSSNKEVRFY